MRPTRWMLAVAMSFGACSSDNVEPEPWGLVDSLDSGGDQAFDRYDAGRLGADHGTTDDASGLTDAGRHHWPPCVDRRQPLHHPEALERCFEQNQRCGIRNSISNGFMCHDFRGEGEGNCFEICTEIDGCAMNRRCAFHDGNFGLCFERCEPGECTCPSGFGCLPFADGGICTPVNPSRPKGATCSSTSWFGCDTALLCATNEQEPSCVPACVPSVDNSCEEGECASITDDWGHCVK